MTKPTRKPAKKHRSKGSNPTILPSFSPTFSPTLSPEEEKKGHHVHHHTKSKGSSRSPTLSPSFSPTLSPTLEPTYESPEYHHEAEWKKTTDEKTIIVETTGKVKSRPWGYNLRRAGYGKADKGSSKSGKYNKYYTTKAEKLSRDDH